MAPMVLYKGYLLVSGPKLYVIIREIRIPVIILFMSSAGANRLEKSGPQLNEIARVFLILSLSTLPSGESNYPFDRRVPDVGKTCVY